MYQKILKLAEQNLHFFLNQLLYADDTALTAELAKQL